MYSSGSGYGPVMGPCEQDNEPVGSIKGGQLLTSNTKKGFCFTKLATDSGKIYLFIYLFSMSHTFPTERQNENQQAAMS